MAAAVCIFVYADGPAAGIVQADPVAVVVRAVLAAGIVQADQADLTEIVAETVVLAVPAERADIAGFAVTAAPAELAETAVVLFLQAVLIQQLQFVHQAWSSGFWSFSACLPVTLIPAHPLF